MANNFCDRVLAVVKQIPKGRVMTYGQIAALCGNPRAARIVGGIAHNADQSLPWQRVIKKDGSLAEGFPGGVSGHQQVLEQEGTKVINGRADVEALRWNP
jgi:methylated-DNA-protein-cysteine methyltransferase-like protein